jgi:hypothetical protein
LLFRDQALVTSALQLAQVYLNLLDKLPCISLMGSSYKLIELGEQIKNDIYTISEMEIACNELQAKNIIKQFRLIKEPLRSYLLVELA